MMGNCLEGDSRPVNRPPPLPPRNDPSTRYVVHPVQHNQSAGAGSLHRQPSEEGIYLSLEGQFPVPSAPPAYQENDPATQSRTQNVQRINNGHQTIRGVQRERPSVMVPENYMRRPSDRVLVAALDVGTTFSGYAFSLLHDYKTDKLKISTNMWAHNSGLSAKAPSAILIGSQKDVVAFGYEAQIKYASLVENSMSSDYYYFEKFKLVLYNNKDLNYNTRMRDIEGKSMKAVDVFGLVIKYLKNHLLDRLQGGDQTYALDQKMIHFVLTIPAIWDDKAKQFMRRAAELAGIKEEQLTLALEPEVASLYCKTVQEAMNRPKIGKGSKYLLADLGGGTVDMTVHEVEQDGRLKELHQATGGRWGGITVDREFYILLMRIFGPKIIEKANKKYPNEMLELLMDFEIKKRTFEPNQTMSVVIKIPACLNELFHDASNQTLSEYLQVSTMKNVIEAKRDKLLVHPEVFNSLFNDSLYSTISHIQNLLDKPNLSGIKTILLVGGYSESTVVKEAMRRTFPDMCIINPEDCSLSVLKGAVIFGHEPQFIKSRICKYTYGIGITIPFVPGEHPESKKDIVRGIALCDDIFDIHLKVGERAELGKPMKERFYDPVEGETMAILEVFASTSENPKFVTEDSCFKLGSLVVSVSTINRRDNYISVTLHYNGTELAVIAKEKNTGKIMKTSMDFLG